MLVSMAAQDDALYAAILAQINAELGAAGLSVRAFAAKLGRPYDSTRNYLLGERTLPLGIFLEYASVLGLEPDVVVARARERL